VTVLFHWGTKLELNHRLKRLCLINNSNMCLTGLIVLLGQLFVDFRQSLLDWIKQVHELFGSSLLDLCELEICFFVLSIMCIKILFGAFNGLGQLNCLLISLRNYTYALIKLFFFLNQRIHLLFVVRFKLFNLLM